MAQYKVPQDVEADDKLLGPFNFRQFIYLLIAAGLIALAVLLFRIFPLLAIIPVPPILLLCALALPLKKDQPMETYLAAIVSYYLKPRTRTWTPGQRESTIAITAPKIVEENRTRNISGEEATHRLSFLADIVDTGGYAIKGVANNSMRDDLVAEANATADMFENNHFDRLNDTISRDETTRHAAVVREMQEAIAKTESFTSPSGAAPAISRHSDPTSAPAAASPRANDIYKSSAVVQPTMPPVEKSAPAPVAPKPTEKPLENPPKPSIIELANNPDFSVATIASEAKRINRKEEGEVFISLH